MHLILQYPNFHGTDKLTFIANDGNENSTIGTVDINTLILTPPASKSKINNNR